VRKNKLFCVLIVIDDMLKCGSGSQKQSGFTTSRSRIAILLYTSIQTFLNISSNRFSFLSYSNLLIPNHCKRRGCLLCAITMTHSHSVAQAEHNTHSTQISSPSAQFKHASPQDYALFLAATGIGLSCCCVGKCTVF
jgi:hypothetical protein